ncbi:MAG: transporter substrate-binding domain-containing protein [gamma proteobacterium symbiont of Taylorina sp.]|nr:transporter substrate-binding domain-containing protein [gamma proteobacterium symbiont of Taylorina sp.]
MPLINKYYFILFLFLPGTNIYAQSLQLTAAEKIWINEHPTIRLAYDNNFPPFEWKNDDGIFTGLSVDLMDLLEKKLNIQFKQIHFKTWSELLTAFKAGHIDILPSIAENKKRQQYILFTKPHNISPGLVISSKKFSSTSELKHKKIGVVNDYFWDDLVSRHDDQFNIIRFESTKDAIEFVVTGQIDAMISDLASITYIMNKKSISNFNVVPIPFDKKKSLKLSIGIRKDWPILKNILQKALDSISNEEQNIINNKWFTLKEISIEKKSFWQDEEFIFKLKIFSMLIFSLFFTIIIWNRSLNSKVKQRTLQLEKARGQLIHAEKMESIGRLSAGVAHEVKNPLAIIQMCIDYLKGEDNDETIISILDDMDDAVLRADTVIKGLLDFSRENKLQFVQGNINEILEQSIKLVRHELKQNSIQEINNFDSNLPLLDMDKNRLKQVFINLLVNAVHAIKSSARINDRAITITTSFIKLNKEIKELFILDYSQLSNHEEYQKTLIIGQNMLLITIVDNGCGLKKDEEKKIFEPFYTTKPVGEGTGLGLSVSKTIIGLHHGIIRMNNRTDNEQGVEIKIFFVLQD